MYTKAVLHETSGFQPYGPYVSIVMTYEKYELILRKIPLQIPVRIEDNYRNPFV